MKNTIYILALIGLIFGCQQKRSNLNNFMDDIREDFAQKAAEENEKTYAFEEKIRILYNRADENLQNGISYADSLIGNDKSLDEWNISELYNIIGELYYDNDSIVRALERFNLSQKYNNDSPDIKANIAGCYIKNGDYDMAMTLLEQASYPNYDYKWYIGNLYEIKREPEKAILVYDSIYHQDTVVYAYYKKRIQELRKHPNKLMNELYYKDRRKRTVMFINGGNSDASGTEIGKFELQERQL